MENEIKQVVAVRKDMNLRRGKQISSGIHAASMFLLIDYLYEHHRSPADAILPESMFDEKFRQDIMDWITKNRYKVIVLGLENEKQLNDVYNMSVDKKLPCFKFQDDGLTEVPAGTCTAISIGPCAAKNVDEVTHFFGLKLL